MHNILIIARTTKGKTLLSGNIYCAHCGGHLAATEGKDRYVRKDGTVSEQTYLRYICYHKSRKINNCDGQSVYLANRVDEIVLDIVERYLDAIKKTPKDKALEIRYKKELSEKRKIKRELSDKKEQLEKQLSELSLEVGKSLCGENRFPIDVLSMSINSTKAEMAEVDRQLNECDMALEKQEDVLNKLDYYYQQFVTWANEFDNASPEQRKMIICQLISSIKVGRGYNIEIEFNASYRQFFGDGLFIEKGVV